MKYHYKDAAGHEVGPISEEELHAFRAGGLLVDETLVKPADTETWTSYATKFGPMPPTNASSQVGTRLTRKQWLAIGGVASLVTIFYGGSIVADAVLNRTPPSAVVSPGIAAAIPQQFSQFEISKIEVVFDNSGSLVSGHALVTLTLKEPFYAKDDFMRRLIEKGDDPKTFESALARRDELPPRLAPVIPNGPSSQLFAEAKPRGYQTTATATLSVNKQSRQWTFTDCVNAWVGHRSWVLARVDWPPLPPEFTGLAARGQLPQTAVLLDEEPGQSALRALLASRQKFIADVRTAEEFVAQQEANYRKAMTQARESLDAGRFADSRKFLAAVLLSKPDDISARNLLAEISGAEKKARDARIAATEQVLPEAGETWENTLGMKFVSVAGVNVLFGIWDVRVQDYQAFVTATHREWSAPRFEQGATHPAVNVNWDDAYAFCAWLTQTERAAGSLAPNQRYRLPTDWEWSVAAGLDESHGGTPQSKNMQIKGVYPWGSEWPPSRGAGNYAGNLNVDNFVNTSPVGSFAANRYGLFDMGGNVWQWCDDFYDGRSGVLAVRGGSFDWSDASQLLSSFRGRPSYPRYFNIGFRCVIDSSGGAQEVGENMPSSATPKAESINYTVQIGDSLAEIARKNNANMQDIINANKISDPSRIRVGQTLLIPQYARYGSSISPISSSLAPVEALDRGGLGQVNEGISIMHRRKIEEVIPVKYLSELDPDGMRIFDSANGAEITRIFRRDLPVVWKIVFSRATVGIFRQQPYVFDQQAGWMIGVSFDLKSRRAGKRVNCRQIVVLTDLGTQGVEVKVFSQTFLTWGEMVMDRNTGQYAAVPHSQPLYDRVNNAALSNAFLDDVEQKLGIRKAVQ